VRNVGSCAHPGCWKRQQRVGPFRVITNEIFSWRCYIFGPGRLGTELCPRVGALGRTRLRATLRSSSCGHPFDQFGVGYGEILSAIKVCLVPLMPLSSCNDIEKPVPLVLHGLVKEV